MSLKSLAHSLVIAEGDFESARMAYESLLSRFEEEVGKVFPYTFTERELFRMAQIVEAANREESGE